MEAAEKCFGRRAQAAPSLDSEGYQAAARGKAVLVMFTLLCIVGGRCGTLRSRGQDLPTNGMLYDNIDQLINEVKCAERPNIQAGGARTASRAALASRPSNPSLAATMCASFKATPGETIADGVMA